MSSYNPEWVADYFDDFADKEWRRLVQTSTDEVKLHVHCHYLREHVQPGSRVLEVGAGAGRFTQLLIELGANVVVADISPVQLSLNREHAVQLGFAHGVSDWLQLDVCDMSVLPDNEFDSVVCYGGPLSYVFEFRATALAEILRVLKPGGIAIISVMSLWGTIHEFLDGVLPIPEVENRRIIATGDLCLQTLPSSKHHCHMFTSHEFRSFLEESSARVLALSASNCISAAWKERLTAVRNDPVQWPQLLNLELEACKASGCLDMGTHLIGVVAKR